MIDRMMWAGTATSMASDFEKLIFRFDRAPYMLNPLRRFGKEIMGFVSKKSRSSTYAEILHWESPTGSPRMCGFSFILLRNGSRDRAKRRGKRGHPCLVPFPIGKGGESRPFAFTCAIGLEYILLIQPSIFSPRAM